MIIKKKTLDILDRCYSVNKIEIDNQLHLVFAEEEIGGRCFDYYGEDFSEKRLVWDNGGGTMSIVPIPNTNGDFLAIQAFFPGFQAKEAKVVWCHLNNDKWEVYDYLKIPYLHRIDICSFDGKLYLIGGVVAKNKDSRDDWSLPGCVIWAQMTANWQLKPQVNEIDCDIYKNHGYTKAQYEAQENYFFSGDNGVFKLNYDKGIFSLSKFVDLAVSDISLIDIDGDGQEELMTIQPFHGDNVCIYKRENNDWIKKYEYRNKIKFAHAIGCGIINKKPCFVFGVRRENMELVMIMYDQQKQEYIEFEIDRNCGPANILLLSHNDEDMLVTCNHSVNEATIYYIEKGETR